jgi:hypothetical protein
VIRNVLRGLSSTRASLAHPSGPGNLCACIGTDTTDQAAGVAPAGLALYLVYRDVALLVEWLSATLGFVETGRATHASCTVTNAEMAASDTLLLEHGNLTRDALPTRDALNGSTRAPSSNQLASCAITGAAIARP